MSVFDKFKDLVGVGDEYEDDFDDYYPEEEIEKPARKSEPNKYRGAKNVVPMHQSEEIMKLVVIEPNAFGESPKLVDELKRRKPVILNLEKLDADVARKIFDFLSGATYALNGNIQKIANNIFVFAPDNVDIYASQQSQVQSPDLSTEDEDDWR